MAALGIAYLSVLAKLREYKDQGDSRLSHRTRILVPAARAH